METEKKSRGREADGRDDAMTARAPEGRRERIPMGGLNLQLLASERPGFQRRWCAKRGTRLQKFLDAGYDYVKDEKNVDEAGDGMGARISKISGDEMLYLMEIPLKWYNEDQAAKNKKRDEIDKTLRRGRIQGATAQDTGAFYRGSKNRGDIVYETTDGAR